MICPVHGEQAGDGIVCLKCFSKQQERVERESSPLRIANTAQALRRSVLEEIARQNGEAA